MKKLLRNWTLPVAIVTGTTLYLLFAFVPILERPGIVLGPWCETLLPIAVFVTLFVTFSKVDFSSMRLVKWHGAVLALQLLLVALLVCAILVFTDRGSNVRLVMEAVLVCVIAPCASAAPVVTGKLGGNLTSMTTFTLLSSVTTALLIPLVFPLVEPETPIGGEESFNLQLAMARCLAILQRLSMVLLLPLLLGAVVRHWVKPVYEWIVRTPDLGFYCWCCALSITAGITVKNIVHSSAGLWMLLLIALLSLVVAVVQFVIGRMIGLHLGEHICTGQAMFQKNTGLSIWVAYTFLNPMSSIGAGCYVLWQNIINSLELWQARRQSVA